MQVPVRDNATPLNRELANSTQIYINGHVQRLYSFFSFLNIPVLCPLVLCVRADGGREGGEKGNQTAVDMLMRPCASVITELLQPFTSTIRGRPQSARQTRQPTASIKSSFFSERGAQFTSENKTKAIPFTLKIHLSNPWKCSGN